ncbi:hypothetical protein [Dictyobacter aurantiacus]|uniref:Uncharacterized protein n=1 Tax=Dictyobacter aurantiacus TaxID=1936993 RepID=A0A401ZA83_9CHLR|nr:hypothetical protein [Dictyobacter aurantiacus]GCE03759.1 hypothetical protein KDAU_10880 [Dictyobacter aurantiacus]
MTRKDSEKDSERPHYYSQFWLDVAAGRHVIGAPKPEDGEAAEEAPEPTPQRRGRFTDASDGQVVHPVAEPVRSSQSFAEPEAEEDTLEASDQDEEFDYQDDQVEEADVPDMDLDSEADEEEEFFEDEEEDEEDDDMNWGRGRKKPKPSRASKLPPKKPGKRDTRRSY